MGHDHSHDHVDISAERGVRRILHAVIAVVVVLTLVGLAAWWPSGDVESFEPPGGQSTRVNATVAAERTVPCAGLSEDDGIFCFELELAITSGENKGETGWLEVYDDGLIPRLRAGDDIRVYEYESATGGAAYSYADRQRDRPLVVLALLFAGAVLLLGRMQGFRALISLVITGIVILGFVFPAILDGQPPLPVALVAASVIAFAALYLTHGVNDTTTVALLGTLGALGLTGLLAWWFAGLAHLTGLADETQVFLLAGTDGIDFRGLALAGMVLGALGVLDDVTVTQVSAVARLREANPSYGVLALYRQAVRIGRDHIASTVNTLVLAYVGAALPLLLFFSNTGVSLADATTSEIVATEVIRTLVGSIGIIAAVPITTLIAAVVVTGTAVPRRRAVVADSEAI